MDLMDMANRGVSWLGDLVMRFFETIAGFFLQFFPDADSGILDSIHAWGNSLNGFDLTFNYFYFVDMELVTAFFNVTVVLLGAYITYIFVRVTLDVIHSLVEMIPFVE